MEQEIFLSGYCCCMDASRMVAVEVDEGKLLEVDCNFGSCPYETDCALAEKIRELIAK